jgi:hypothetical protein
MNVLEKKGYSNIRVPETGDSDGEESENSFIV